MTYFRIISLLLLLLTGVPASAMEQDSLQAESILPPLSRVQEAAVSQSPLLKRESAAVEHRRMEKDVNSGAWLKGLTVEAATQYGSYGDQSMNKLYLGNRVGATLRLSLDELFLRGSRSDRDEAAVTVAVYHRQHLERELREVVAQHYVKTETNLRLVRVAADAVQIARTLQQNAELKFRAGEMALYDYSRILDLSASAAMTLERTRGELQQEWMVLEEIIGVPLATLRRDP